MSEPGCRQFRHFAAELALDVLPGRERGNALRHMDGCSRCRDAVHSLAGTADQLIELVPEACPPEGFERKVTAALTASARRHRRWPARTTALLGGVALIAAGWLALPRSGSAGPTDGAAAGVRLVRYAPLLSQDHQVGLAYFYPGDPPWIYLSVATPPTAAGTDVNCEAVRQDGATTSLGTLPLNHGQGGWTVPTAGRPDPVVAAQLVDQNGHTVATARFAPPPRQSSGHPDPGRPNTDHAGRDDDHHTASPDDHSRDPDHQSHRDHSDHQDHSDHPDHSDNQNHSDNQDHSGRQDHSGDHHGKGSDNGHGGSGHRDH